MAQTLEERKAKKKAYMRTYQQENAEQLRLKKKAYQIKHRLENPEETRTHSREYYAKHRAQYRRRVNERKREKIRKLNECKATLKCSMCGQSFPDFPSVIEFHHTGKDPKADTIGSLMGESPSSKRLRTELAKCIPYCANCHRRVHHLEEQKKKGVVIDAESLGRT